MDKVTPFIEIEGKRYDQETGARLTPCCQVYPTYSGNTLCCKNCYEEMDKESMNETVSEALGEMRGRLKKIARQESTPKPLGDALLDWCAVQEKYDV